MATRRFVTTGFAVGALSMAAPVIADSPLTSTDIASAYTDISAVVAAQGSATASDEVLAFLLADNPLDQKAAAINALGWDVEGQDNGRHFLSGLAATRGVPIDELALKQLSPDNKFVLGYLLAMDDYFEMGPLVLGSIGVRRASAVELLEQAAFALPQDFTAHYVKGLVVAQKLMYEQSWCAVYTSMGQVMDRFTTQNRNMRLEAVASAQSYIEGYGDYCGTTVTIETREGDTIDAVLFRANESTVEIRVAGQLLTLPLETIRYISFDGRLGASADGGEEGEQLELRAAMSALRILKAQADALDTEKSENQVFLIASLNAALPSITTFLSSDGDDWADVNHAIRRAVQYYRAAPDDDGTLAGRDLRRAREYVDYADKLSGAPGERRHREDAGEVRVLSLNQPVGARLGAGDREMARDLDGSSAGAYNDLFQFTLTEPMRTEIVLLCDPCRPHLTLTGAEGEKLEGDAAGYTNRSRIRRDLEAGTYYIWAGATGRGDVGEYTLTVGPRE